MRVLLNLTRLQLNFFLNQILNESNYQSHYSTQFDSLRAV